MLRFAAKGITKVLLELVTVALVVAIAAFALSAYITARLVGVQPTNIRRTSAVVKFLHGLIANTIASQRNTRVGNDTGSSPDWPSDD